MPDAPNTYYHTFGGYVVRDEIMPITLYQGTKREKQIEVRVTVLADRPAETEER